MNVSARYLCPHFIQHCMLCAHTGVVKAFDEAWEANKGDCANYFR